MEYWLFDALKKKKIVTMKAAITEPFPKNSSSLAAMLIQWLQCFL